MKARDPISDPHLISDRCTATSKGRGEQCRRSAIPGGRVCRYHGGAAPQVKAKALERLMALQHPAITRLGQLVDQTEFPSTAMAAVKDVLDRTMGKPVESVELTGAGGGPVETVFRWKA